MPSPSGRVYQARFMTDLFLPFAAFSSTPVLRTPRLMRSDFTGSNFTREIKGFCDPSRTNMR